MGTAPTSIRVSIPGQPTLFREGLRALLRLEPGVSLHDSRPDVVIMADYDGDQDLRSAIEDATGAERRVAVLAVVPLAHAEQVRRAFDAGAAGVLNRNADLQELRSALQVIASGDEYVEPSVGAALLKLERGSGGGEAGSETLTARERDILRLIALGHTNPEIAGILHVAVRTVEAHRSNMLRKLGIRSRAELVRYAKEHGLTM